MNWHSYLGQEYIFFNVTVSCLITLKSQKMLHPKTLQNLFLRSQAAIMIASHNMNVPNK